MDHMADLAELGHTIIASVHQPRTAIWEMFHKVRCPNSGTASRKFKHGLFIPSLPAERPVLLYDAAMYLTEPHELLRRNPVPVSRNHLIVEQPRGL